MQQRRYSSCAIQPELPQAEINSDSTSLSAANALPGLAMKRFIAESNRNAS
jgi:hypothetical protein